MTVTLRDIAKKSGLSVPTVSLVLSGRGRELKISNGSIMLVQGIAEELGYRRNYQGLTLKTGQSMTLGVVQISDAGSLLTCQYWSLMAAGIDHAARLAGYHILLLGASPSPHPLEDARQVMDQHRVDAMIVLGEMPRIPSAFAHHDVPCVFLDNQHSAGRSNIAFDALPGLDAAVAHLHELGHRRLLWIAPAAHGKEGNPERRQQAARSAAQRGMELTVWHLESAHERTPDDRLMGCYREDLLRLLPFPDHITAVMCGSDVIALTLQALLHDHGVRIPEQCSVIGFDDVQATLAFPPLTTISHALFEMGSQAVAVALQRIAQRGKHTCIHAAVASRLVIRHSTGPAPDVAGPMPTTV